MKSNERSNLKRRRYFVKIENTVYYKNKTEN